MSEQMNRPASSGKGPLYIIIAVMAVLLIGGGIGVFLSLNAQEKKAQHQELAEAKQQIEEQKEQLEEKEKLAKASEESKAEQTPTEKVSKSQIVYGRVNDSDGYTNVRKGPGTEYDIVERINDGNRVAVNKADINKAWARLYDDNGVLLGYMSTKKIVYSSQSDAVEKEPSLDWATVNDADGYTNIRKGPGTQYEVIGTIDDGESILVNTADKNKGWARVYMEASKDFWGYMSTKKLVW